MKHLTIKPTEVVSKLETRDRNVTAEGSSKATIVIRRVSKEEFEKLQQSELTTLDIDSPRKLDFE